ncbi:hypothetical protein [Pseudarthrobacter sulfonivorans]|uniref:hypothetical protein n=1 Tax=Pseudarthrobacter sulfonivorans TaxID=121292 RepID=UPI00285670B6|nr:hypothetical protein [Pseudarthrobacter sulfonivorans]MDR6413286.1 hypothetical protein [Pseudarthrobacter sulfonivorans]
MLKRWSASVARLAALVMSFVRAPAMGRSSVNVVLGQPGSGQRQTRSIHSNRTGCRNRECHGADPPPTTAYGDDAAARTTVDISFGLHAHN